MLTSRIVIAALVMALPLPALAQEAAPAAEPPSAARTQAPPAGPSADAAPERAAEQATASTRETDAQFDQDAGKPVDTAQADPMEAMPDDGAMVSMMPELTIDGIVAALRPGARADYADPDYLRNIYRTPTVLRPDIGDEAVHDPAGRRLARTFILNTNHSQVVTLPFETASYTLSPAAMVDLDTLGTALQRPALEGATYLIAGHTDTTGEAAANHWLSEKRANAVRAFLIMEHGIAPQRLVAVGFGEDAPMNAADGTDPKNRRIEVTLIEHPSRAADIPLAEVPLSPSYDRDDFAYRAVPAPLYDAASVQPVGPNPVCDTALAYRDSRPARHNLDDFGGFRTPVGCDPEMREAQAGQPLRTRTYGSTYATRLQNRAIRQDAR